MEDNIPTGWTDEKQPVAPMGEVTFSYFLRLAGKSADKLADVRAAFGEAETIELPEMDEFAVHNRRNDRSTLPETGSGIRGRYPPDDSLYKIGYKVKKHAKVIHDAVCFLTQEIHRKRSPCQSFYCNGQIKLSYNSIA